MRLKTLTFVLAFTLVAAALTLIPGPSAYASFPAALACEGGPTGGYCQASPANKFLEPIIYTYEWTASGPISIHQGTSISNFRQYCCVGAGSGYVSVTITDDFDQQITVAKPINCPG